MNSISYWLSLAQLKTNATFLIAFRMHSLSHKILFHDTDCIMFLYHWYQKSIPDWSCLMLTKDKNVKRDTDALAMLSYSYLNDKLNNGLSDGGFILSE